MSEITLQWIKLFELVWVVIYAGLYGFGGISGKWKRRVIGSTFLTVGIVGFSLWVSMFSWWLLLVLPLLYGATSIGYGADETWLKVTKRSYCGFSYACATLPVFIVKGMWELWILHTLFCLITSIWLGVRNPLDSARAEETAIGFIIAFLPLLIIG